VRDDEVVRVMEGDGKGVAVMSLETGFDIGSCRLATLVKELKHGAAAVDCIGVEVWVVLEELREEATVSITQDQSASAIDKLRKKVVAAVFERATEGEIFEPVVGTGDEVKVRLVTLHWWRKKNRRSGVVSAKSADARRVTGAIAKR
jgi:hypothetical protein